MPEDVKRAWACGAVWVLTGVLQHSLLIGVRHRSVVFALGLSISLSGEFPVSLTASLVLGEVVGYAIELQLRASFLRAREEQQRQVEAQTESYRRDNEQLRQRANARDHFVASLSHEMRTPLNGVLGTLQLAQAELDAGADNLSRARLGALVETALTGCFQLHGLVEDTLNVTRIEQGRLALHVRPMSLPSLCRACVELVRASAPSESVALDVAIQPAVEEAGSCMGDPVRLQQQVNRAPTCGGARGPCGALRIHAAALSLSLRC
jgi:signal transduction histidine kinase